MHTHTHTHTCPYTSTHSLSLQTHTMQHTPTMYCLELSENGKEVYMNKCDGSPSQEWVWARHYTPKRTVRQWYQADLFIFISVYSLFRFLCSNIGACHSFAVDSVPSLFFFSPIVSLKPAFTITHYHALHNINVSLNKRKIVILKF